MPFNWAKLHKLFLKDPTLSLRDAAIIIGVSHQTVLNKIRNEKGLGFTDYKRFYIKEQLGGADRNN